MSRSFRLRRRGASYLDANRRLPPASIRQDFLDRAYNSRQAIFDRVRPVYLQDLGRLPFRRSPRLTEALHPIAEPVVRSPRSWAYSHRANLLRDRSIKSGKYYFCFRRRVRREVIHALGVAGKRGIGIGGVRRTPESYYHCGG